MKKWSRILALLLAAVLALGLTACNSGAEAKQSEQPSYEDEGKRDRQENQAKSLYERGMEMVDLIRQMADSKEFLALKYSLGRDELDAMDDSPESEPIAVLARMRNQNLECAYQIATPLVSYWELVEPRLKELGLDVDNISPELRKQLSYGMQNSLLSSLIGSRTMETLTSNRGYSVTYASILTNNFRVSDAFANDEMEEDVAYLYMFEDVAVMVTFTKNAGGAVSATAMPVFADEIVGASRLEIRELLEDAMGTFGFEVEVTDIAP